MTHGNVVVAVGERGVAADTPLREHLIEQDRVDPAEGKIAIRVDVVFVRDRNNAEVLLCGDEQVVGERGSERGDPTPSQVAERAVPVGIRLPDGEHFAEFVIGNRDGQPGAPRRRIFDPAQADVEVSAHG